MAKKRIPTPAELRQLLDCDPATGKLFWKPRTAEMFTGGWGGAEVQARRWNSTFAGKEAFTYVGPDGYRQGSVNNCLLRGHRVIWAWVTGEWPVELIDHIDGNRDNNSFSNLREATRQQNNKNVMTRRDTVSGLKGVTWCRLKERWKAQIGNDGKNYHLGYFECRKEAHSAYLDASARLHGEFARQA